MREWQIDILIGAIISIGVCGVATLCLVFVPINIKRCMKENKTTDKGKPGDKPESSESENGDKRKDQDKYLFLIDPEVYFFQVISFRKTVAIALCVLASLILVCATIVITNKKTSAGNNSQFDAVSSFDLCIPARQHPPEDRETATIVEANASPEDVNCPSQKLHPGF